MQFSASLALIVIVGLVASGSALPAKKRMVYYQQPATPQRMMYVHYVQPARPFARSTQAAAALVAGNTVATGTYLNDYNHEEAAVAAASPAVDVSVEHGEDVLSEAAAYPVAGDAAPVPAEIDIVAEENEVADEAADAEIPAVEAEAPVAKPAKRNLSANKKKVYVELDQSVESQEDNSDAEEEDEIPVAKKPAKATPASATKPQKPLPAGTFFQIDFDGTAGGAIAIANSLSTNDVASSKSHAIAYGSSDSVRARARPSKFH